MTYLDKCEKCNQVTRHFRDGKCLICRSKNKQQGA